MFADAQIEADKEDLRVVKDYSWSQSPIPDTNIKDYLTKMAKKDDRIQDCMLVKALAAEHGVNEKAVVLHEWGTKVNDRCSIFNLAD